MYSILLTLFCFLGIIWMGLSDNRKGVARRFARCS
uniref:Uncharacterized protein n=1 Tax=Musa acuminata subsp. malaccensis TaxID=214687 RepID=A0A804KQL9_MUSAM